MPSTSFRTVSNDPEDIFARQIEFIRASAIPLAMVGLLQALPETQLSRRLGREGRLRKESTGNNTDRTFNFQPIMDEKRLLAGFDSIVGTIYNPREYYERVLASMERVPLGEHTPRNTGILRDALTLSRLVWRLGLRGPAPGEFWKFTRQILNSHPKRFAEGMAQAARGYHLYRVLQLREQQ